MNRAERTRHASRRIRQRGISDMGVRLIEIFGVDRLQKGGTWLSFIPVQQLTEMRRALDRLQGVCLIKSGEDKIITALHLHRHVRATDYVA